MLSLITRVQHDSLYQRLLESVKRTAVTDLEILSERDTDGQPRVVDTYNRLGAKASGDILVFCEDDVVMLEQGWDARLIEFFAFNDFQVGGVVGVDKYRGGDLFSAGHPHCFGKFVNQGGEKVSLYGPSRSRKIVAVDGSFMAVSADHFKSEKFDEKLDGLFFYDVDYCLRSRVGLVDILIGHYKPSSLYGKYPADMKPIESYEPYFNEKHGFGPVTPGDTRALSATLEDYETHGHETLWKMFQEKYLVQV